MKKVLVRFLQRRMLARQSEREALYRATPTSEAQRKAQLAAFNAVWRDAWTNLPFYANWKKQNSLPDAISSLSELSTWPVITKKDFQLADASSLLREGIAPTGHMMTGGSTGEPLRLPTWADGFAGSSMAMGRAAYGIAPGDRWFFLWGHHHLYGHGFHRWLATHRQQVKDWLLNRLRVPSYDLSEATMRTNYKKFTAWAPKVFGGFSAAVLAFVRINRLHGNLSKHPVEVVFCTAGPLTKEERREIFEYFNGAPICMEYGSNDCGVMAYTQPGDGLYRTFWDTHLLQGVRDAHGEVKNIVTRLTPCYVPMIRFDIGDYLELEHETDSLDSVLVFRSIKGRPSDQVTLRNGASFFGALVGDCIKQIPSVVSSQTCVYDASRIEIRIVSLSRLTDADLVLVKGRFLDVATSVQADQVSVRQIQMDDLVRTPAGKIPLIVKS